MRTGQDEVLVLVPGDVVVVDNRRAAQAAGVGAQMRARLDAGRPLLHLRPVFTTAAAAVVADPDHTPGALHRQAVENGVPVVSEAVVLKALTVLEAGPRSDGACACEARALPRWRAVRTWEDHDYGSCGWPEAACQKPTHRRLWCRGCSSPLDATACRCADQTDDTGVSHAGPEGFTFDPDRNWWVHAGCGWPTTPILTAWRAGTGAGPNADNLDGTPTPVWRTHPGRDTSVDAIRPLPADIATRDRAQTGRPVRD